MAELGAHLKNRCCAPKITIQSTYLRTQKVGCATAQLPSSESMSDYVYDYIVM